MDVSWPVDVWIPRIPTVCGNGLFFPMIQAEETVRKEPSTYGFSPGMKVAGCGGVWQSSMEKHRKTCGKDREHPLKARDFHIYVSLHGSELFILNYLVRALVHTQSLRSDGMQIRFHQKVEASTSRLGYSSKLPGFWNVFVVEHIKRWVLSRLKNPNP